MKICIYGAGAIGGYLGVLLKDAGSDVSLIARGAHLKAIQANGLKLLIDGGEKVAKFPATSDPKELGPQDYVIVALKAHQAWEVAEQMLPLFHDETAVVTAQNGLPGGTSTASRVSTRTGALRASIPARASGTRSAPSAPSAARSIPPPK